MNPHWKRLNDVFLDPMLELVSIAPDTRQEELAH